MMLWPPNVGKCCSFALSNAEELGELEVTEMGVGGGGEGGEGGRHK